MLDADIYHKVLGSDHCPVSIELDVDYDIIGDANI